VLAEHQVDAVARCRALLLRYDGAILADDVGLGKSFVAAELARAWSRVELIIPAALIAQWQETLAAFGVNARIFTHDGLAADAFVADGADRLVIVDEAHAFRNPRTRRYAALARRSIGARVLLVTATPVCNSVDDLRALVDLLAPDDLLAAEGVPSIDVAFERRDRALIERIVSTLIVRRDRSVLPDELQFGDLDRRVIRHPVIAAARPLIDELQFPLIGESALLKRFLWRRLESSEAALLESLRRQTRFYERALECLAAGRALPKRDYRRAFGHEEDRDAFQQVLFWELFVPPASGIDAEELREELARMEMLRAVVSQSPQRKRQLLLDVVRSCADPLLIFTGAAATARDLYDALSPISKCGLVTARERTRDAVLLAFRSGRIDVVISTDLASEGLNLQRAGTVIHYDLPWNPVKLDQRNGRTHRIGQARDLVRAIYFLPESRDSRIIETIARKNRTRRRVLATSAAALPPPPATATTLRPRITNAAILRFAPAAEAAGLPFPPTLDRRHKAGLERLLMEMATEYLDQQRIADLVAVL
jgi:superfamily II DNA or RNA helicase